MVNAKRGLSKDKSFFYSVQRCTLEKGARPRIHSHEQAELFWIESGSGMHMVNDLMMPLYPGILVMIRPSDRHACYVARNTSLTYVSLSFPGSTVSVLRDRYFSHQKNFWSGDKVLPTHHYPPLSLIAKLSREIELLASLPLRPFFLEHFLMDVIYGLTLVSEHVETRGAPSWLKAACDLIRAPEHFVKGPLELARLAGRCPSHVARVAKSALGKTPGEIVNDARIEYASAELVSTDKQIIDICMDCGFESLSHFYRLFKQRFDVSPKEYRRSAM